MTRRSTFTLKLTLLATCLVFLLAACGGGDKPPTGVSVPDEGRTHVNPGTSITYKHYPPASGPHYPSPIAWRLYDTEQPEGSWVHNLEHGGVVILYNCKGQPCTQLKSQLDGLYSKIKLDKFNEQKLLITANSKISTQLAIIAWGWVDQFDGFDEKRLLAFFNNRVNKGPEDVP